MTGTDFSVKLVVEQTPKEVFDAVSDVRGWWTENMEGSSQKLNDEFEVRFGDVHYSRHKLAEVVLYKRIVWLVTDSRLSFVKEKDEWTNTKVNFEITSQGEKTQLVFTHIGLSSGIECYDACSNAWSGYVNKSLYDLITKGKGRPDPKAVKSEERSKV
jgi:hypothetical protein